ncbi:hypothetical protein [Humibacter sp.]|uniref:hypothetical protein n=1 Tax=Humibacter sp. TaxID=1940291 RepID=UPI003F7F85ED
MTSPVRVLGFNERGIPQAPADVVRRLAAIDPNLALKCYRWGVEDQWTVVWKWLDTDPRMARVQSGEIDPATACDILAYLPLEVRPDDVPAYILPMLKSMGNAGYDYVETLTAKVRAANEATKEGHWAPTLERAHEAIETNAGKLFADTLGTVPKVYVTNPTPKKARKRRGE